MKVCLCSAFRSSSAYIDRYTDQAIALLKALKRSRHELSVVWGEGDSTDDTFIRLSKALKALAISGMGRGEIVDCSHGGPAYDSVVDAQRFKQLAYVGNCIWKAIPDDANVVVFVEADLIWTTATMTALIKRLKEFSAVSPMILLQREGYPERTFWDTWAFRRDARRFSQNYPYHREYDPHRPFRVDSAGSCMAMHGVLAQQLVWDEKVFVGICEQIYKLGGKIYVDPTLACIHN